MDLAGNGEMIFGVFVLLLCVWQGSGVLSIVRNDDCADDDNFQSFSFPFPFTFTSSFPLSVIFVCVVCVRCFVSGESSHGHSHRELPRP